MLNKLELFLCIFWCIPCTPCYGCSWHVLDRLWNKLIW